MNGTKIDLDALKAIVLADDTGVKYSSLDLMIKVPEKFKLAFAWIDSFCPFSSEYDVDQSYGVFPEVDEEFYLRHKSFEERLCLRRIRMALPKFYEPIQLNNAVEDLAISYARQCGYSGSNIFPRFAFAFLMFEGTIVKREYALPCSGQSDFRQQSSMATNIKHQPVAFSYYIEIFGSKSVAERYINFADKILKERGKLIDDEVRSLKE